MKPKFISTLRKLILRHPKIPELQRASDLLSTANSVIENLISENRTFRSVEDALVWMNELRK